MSMDDYNESSLDYEELIENVLNIDTAANLQLLSLSAQKWNEKSKEIKVSESLKREAIALPTLVDESGDLSRWTYRDGLWAIRTSNRNSCLVSERKKR